jgi:hypothetical protein
MPRFLEDRLKAQATKEGLAGKSLAHYVYGSLNNQGLMSGNKETAKGKALDRKHAADMTHPARNLGSHLKPRKRG